MYYYSANCIHTYVALLMISKGLDIIRVGYYQSHTIAWFRNLIEPFCHQTECQDIQYPVNFSQEVQKSVTNIKESASHVVHLRFQTITYYLK